MLFVSLATAFQVWTLNLHHRGSRDQTIPLIFRNGLLRRITALLHRAKVSRAELDRQAKITPTSTTNSRAPPTSPVCHRQDIVRGDIDREQFNRYFREHPVGGKTNNVQQRLPLSPGHVKVCHFCVSRKKIWKNRNKIKKTVMK